LGLFLGARRGRRSLVRHLAPQQVDHISKLQTPRNPVTETRTQTARALEQPRIQPESRPLSQTIGSASLAIILIGLVVTWSGFVNRVRWTWFVMFIMVWVWLFPWLILPYFRGPILTIAGAIQRNAMLKRTLETKTKSRRIFTRSSCIADVTER
jgi:hypothetical protein